MFCGVGIIKRSLFFRCSDIIIGNKLKKGKYVYEEGLKGWKNIFVVWKHTESEVDGEYKCKVVEWVNKYYTNLNESVMYKVEW